MKFNLKTLLLSVVLVAFVCVAMANARHSWLRYLYAVSFVILATSLTRAVVQRGAQRAFNVGFCVFGVGYWLVLFTPLNEPFKQVGYVTDTVMFKLHPLFERQIPTEDAFEEGWTTEYKLSRLGQRGTPTVRVPTIDAFLSMSRPVWAICLAVAGGVIGRLSYRCVDEASETSQVN